MSWGRGKKALPGRLPGSLRVGSRSVHANESAETPVNDDEAASELDLVAIGSPLLDVLEVVSRRGARPGGVGQGVDDPDRPGAGHRGPAGHARPAVRLRRIGGQHGGGPVRARRAGRVHRRRGRRRGRAHLRGEPAGRRRGVRAGRRRRDRERTTPGHGPLHGAHLRRRRADHGDVSRGGLEPDRRGRVGGPGGAGLDRVARGLPVGRGRGQGGHAARRGHRARRPTARSPSPCRIRSASPGTSASSSTCLVDDIDILLGNEEEITMLFGATSHDGGARGGRGDRPPGGHDAGAPRARSS